MRIDIEFQTVSSSRENRSDTQVFAIIYLLQAGPPTTANPVVPEVATICLGSPHIVFQTVYEVDG